MKIKGFVSFDTESDSALFGRMSLKLSLSQMQNFGYALSFTWFWALLCGSFFADILFKSSQEESVGKLIFLAVYLLSLVLFSVMLKKSTRHKEILRILAAVAFLFIAVGFVLVGFRITHGSWVSFGLFGFGTASLIVLWDYYFLITPIRNAQKSYYVIGGATVLGALVLLLLNFMHATYAIVLLFCCYLLSLGIVWFLLFFTCFKESGLPNSIAENTRVKKTKSQLAGKALLYIFGYSIAFAYLVFQVNSLPPQFVSSNVMVGAIIFSGLIIWFCLTVGKVKRLFEELVRWFLPTGIIMLLAFFLDLPYPMILASIAIFGVVISAHLQSRIAYTIKVGSQNKEYAYNPSFMRMRMSSAFGMLLGWATLLFLSALAQEETDLLILLVMLMAFVLITAFGVGEGAFNLQADKFKNETGETESKSDNQGLYRIACQKFSETHGLTERQQEVLYHLGKGRNARFIQNKLGISEHTVKTHIYNIFAKAGVHSQQELMSLLDDCYAEQKEKD